MKLKIKYLLHFFLIQIPSLHNVYKASETWLNGNSIAQNSFIYHQQKSLNQAALPINAKDPRSLFLYNSGSGTYCTFASLYIQMNTPYTLYRINKNSPRINSHLQSSHSLNSICISKNKWFYYNMKINYYGLFNAF